jgi:hypothetical protein
MILTVDECFIANALIGPKNKLGMDNPSYLYLKNPRLAGTPQQAVHNFAGSKRLL